MKEQYEIVRKTTTFLLATFLWLHALFFWNIQSPLLAECSRLLRLATSEIVLLSLLVIFSFLAASGFWKLLRSLIYIYFFPFVLIGYALYLCFRMLRAMNRWFKAQANPQSTNFLVIESEPPKITTAVSQNPDKKIKSKTSLQRFVLFLTRPFRRFTLLWCILLLATTHTSILWLCLIVVLAHLARKLFFILKILFFSGALLKRIGTAMPAGLYNALSALNAITREVEPSNELVQLWNQLKFWEKILNFLKDEYLLSRWAWVLGTIFFGAIYIYIAALFSFAYYGISRVAGVYLSWPDALVDSIFIPFLVSELPKILAIKILAGFHCSLIVTIGVGTIVNFLRRKLERIRKAASSLSNRFTEQSIQEKILILEKKVSDSGLTIKPIK